MSKKNAIFRASIVINNKLIVKDFPNGPMADAWLAGKRIDHNLSGDRGLVHEVW